MNQCNRKGGSSKKVRGKRAWISASQLSNNQNGTTFVRTKGK